MLPDAADVGVTSLHLIQLLQSSITKVTIDNM